MDSCLLLMVWWTRSELTISVFVKEVYGDKPNEIALAGTPMQFLGFYF